MDVSTTSLNKYFFSVRYSPDDRVRNREVLQSFERMAPVAQNVLPDLLSNLSWLADSSNEASSSPSPLTAMSARSRRRRSASESSNPDETKISVTAIVTTDCCAQDWIEVSSLTTSIFYFILFFLGKIELAPECLPDVNCWFLRTYLSETQELH